MSKPLEMYSPLTPPECAARIAAEMDYEPFWLGPFAFWTYFGINPVIGRVTSSSIRLRARIRSRDDFFQTRRISLQRALIGRMRGQGTGTTIQLRLTNNLLTIIFFLVWCNGILFVCVLSIAALPGPSFANLLDRLRNVWPIFLLGPGLLLTGLTLDLFGFGRSLAADEGELLVDFISYTLSVSKEPYLGPKPPKEHLRGNPP